MQRLDAGSRDELAADLAPREGVLLQHHHVAPGTRQQDRGARARGSAAEDERVTGRHRGARQTGGRTAAPGLRRAASLPAAATDRRARGRGIRRAR